MIRVCRSCWRKATSTDVQLTLALELTNSKTLAKIECNRALHFFVTVTVSGKTGNLTILLWLSDTSCKAEPLFKFRPRQTNHKKKSACDMVKTWVGSHKADAELKRTRLHTARPAKWAAQKPDRRNKPRNEARTKHRLCYFPIYIPQHRSIFWYQSVGL